MFANAAVVLGAFPVATSTTCACASAPPCVFFIKFGRGGGALDLGFSSCSSRSCTCARAPSARGRGAPPLPRPPRGRLRGCPRAPASGPSRDMSRFASGLERAAKTIDDDDDDDAWSARRGTARAVVHARRPLMSVKRWANREVVRMRPSGRVGAVFLQLVSSRGRGLRRRKRLRRRLRFRRRA